MYGYPIKGSFSLLSILSGLSKTLNVANKIIPLYKQAKPVISNARNIIETFKNINKNTDEVKIKKEPLNSSLINKPQFFI